MRNIKRVHANRAHQRRSTEDGEAYSTEEEIFQPTKPNTAMAVPLGALPSSRSSKGVADSLVLEKQEMASPPHGNLLIGNEGDIGMVR